MHRVGGALRRDRPLAHPDKPGVQRKHDTYDAIQLARLHRAGELTVIRIPTEAEERVRDLVRCCETFQRELVGFLWSVMQDLDHPVAQTT